jgi:channel protein (hemolysin III family)
VALHLAAFPRLDHADMFLMIAGMYTPICLALPDGTQQRVVLGAVWAGAAAGIVFRVVWLSAPAWLYNPFEVFHTCTLVGFATHYIAVALAVS